jgi:hypothetical protein
MQTNTHAIAAFIAANTPIDPARYGDPELRARCANCAQAHPTWRCPEIGAVLHAPDDDASDIQAALDRLERLVDKEAEIASLRQQIERLQGHARYVWSQLRGAYAREEAAREALATAEEHIGALVGACDEAHQVLWHYDLVRQPNGVDWEPVAELQARLIAQLEQTFDARAWQRRA